MSENKFENQVQHLMDELKFTPSEEVWPAIKNRIREKRRRRFFLFLIPVIAGFLYTGYYFFTKTNSLPVSKNEVVYAPAEKLEISEPGKEHISGNTPDIKNSKTIQTDEPTLSSIGNNIEPPKIKSNNEIVNIDPDANQIPYAKQNQPEEFKTSIGAIDTLLTQTKPDQHTDEKLLNESSVNENLQSNIIQSSITENFQDSASADSVNILNETIADTIAHNKDTARIVLIEKDQHSKWIWGLHVAVGASRSGSKTLPGIGSSVMDYNTAPNAGGPLFASPAKSSNTGAAFEAGFVLKKQLTPRSNIVTGLQYHYASDRIMAGSRYDSTIRLQNSSSGSGSFDNTINNYYRGNDQWYNNQYHFIELPVQYQFLLIKKSKLPVQIQAGLIFSQLISTNGLVYDRALAGIYYEDKDQFNQSMLSLSSGINFQFNQKQKLKWSVGPQLRTSITSMRKATYDQNKYLFSAGLRINLFID